MESERTSEPLTLEMLQRTVDDARRFHDEALRRENEAYSRFMDSVPEYARKDTRILSIAALVARSQGNPLHPNHAKQLGDYYREVLEELGEQIEG